MARPESGLAPTDQSSLPGFGATKCLKADGGGLLTPKELVQQASSTMFSPGETCRTAHAPYGAAEAIMRVHLPCRWSRWMSVTTLPGAQPVEHMRWRFLHLQDLPRCIVCPSMRLM